jgi:hypothetical protein
MKNLNSNSQLIKGMQPLSRAEMKNIVGSQDPPVACANVTCPPGTSLVVTQLSPSTYECTCQCGPTSYCT